MLKFVPHGYKPEMLAKTAKKFDPNMPVRIVFWGGTGKGMYMAMGFSQDHCTRGKLTRRGQCEFFGGYFSPRISPLEYEGGFIKFGEKTKARFRKIWLKLFGVEPLFDS